MSSTSTGHWAFDSWKMTQQVLDSYGFSHALTGEEAVQRQMCETRAREQQKTWWEKERTLGPGWYEDELEAGQNGFVGGFSMAAVTAVANGSSLKKLIRKGIPAQSRAKVWWSCSGAGKKEREAGEGYYANLLKLVEGKETVHTRQIDNDVHRTFPGHPWLDSEEGKTLLRRVLVAYSWRNPGVGYCQSMNYVTAFLLLVMRSEEHAFWMLATLLEDILYEDSYSGDLSGCHVETRVLGELLEKKLPRLAVLLEKLGCELALLCTEWFLCLFVKSLPPETTMRIWDVLFNEGAKVIFRVALALLKMNEANLLKTKSVGELIHLLQDATRHTYDRDELMKVAFEKLGSFPMKSILKQRRRQHPLVMAELQDRLRKHENKSS